MHAGAFIHCIGPRPVLELQQPLQVAIPHPPVARSRSPPFASGSTSLPVLAKRKDTPFVRETQTRGSLAMALQACGSQQTRQDALEVYQSRTCAQSSHSAASFNWNTWCLIHERWYGTGVNAIPVLPLTPSSIQAVVAALIKGQYRSVPNFVSRAKEEHTRNFQWDSMVDREARRANRAGTRGLGPSHQTAELPVLLAYATALECLGPKRFQSVRTAFSLWQHSLSCERLRRRCYCSVV